MADQPALGPNGQLLDALKIMWYNNPYDDHPIQPTSDMHCSIAFNLLALLRDLSVIIIQVTALEVRHRLPQVVHDWLQLSMQRNMMNSATFFNHITNMLVLDNPATPMPLSSTSEPLWTMLVLMQMMTTSALLPLMMDWTMMVTLTSCKLVMMRYQAMKLLPILQLTEVYTLQIADMLPSKTVPEINNGKKQTHTLKPKVKVTTTAPLKKKARPHSVEVEKIEDEDSAWNITMRNSGISLKSSFQILDTKKVSH